MKFKMIGVFSRPKISPFMINRIENLRLALEEEEEDIQEGLEALADKKGTITWEQYERQRMERESRGELPD
ncbi:MAG: hypothetical protein V3V80_04375 [Dehalococcoidia bacterium]